MYYVPDIKFSQNCDYEKYGNACFPPASLLLDLFFGLEDGGNIIFRNIRKCPSHMMTTQKTVSFRVVF
jgi:hypothetical protein